MNKTNIIFHLIEKEVWDALPKEEPYAPSSLASEGFIHFSTKSQLPNTLQRYYPADIDMIALEIKVNDFPSDVLKWEESYPEEFFPHIYAFLDLSKIKQVHDARTL